MSADLAALGHRRVTDHATEIVGPLEYRGSSWHEQRRSRVTASEIAAILQLSPPKWNSPFNVWWSKKLADEPEPETAQMRRGQRLEPLIIEDFTDAHPEFHIFPAGLCVNDDRPWQACTPDGILTESHSTTEPGAPVALLEVKTAAGYGEWGDAGTDDIPVHYRAQVLWQLDTLGLDVGYVAVWLPGFTYREYVIERDAADLQLMRKAAADFLTSLDNDQPPDLDASPATTRQLKRLHPDLVDTTVELPAQAVEDYHSAKADRDAADARVRHAQNRIRDALQNCRTGTVNGRKAVTRSISDIAERTQFVRAHTRDVLTFIKPENAHD